MNKNKMDSVILFGLLCGMVVCVFAKPKLIEGDIVWDKKLDKIRADNKPIASGGRVKRSLYSNTHKTHEHRWKRGLVPYLISTDLGKPARKAIEQAFRQIEKYTCVRFTPRMRQRDYVEFILDDGCYSSIGRQNGRQEISIGPGCEYLSNVVHEILHTLGMFHEQTRIDRDLYVHVLWWNVQRGAERNFDIYHHGIIDSIHFPYDFRSATHYYNKDFSKNGGDTIQALENPQKPLGNHRGMSKIDMKKINIFYKCWKKGGPAKKDPCRDRFFMCHNYLHYCKTKWFAIQYCQRSCNVCIP